MKIVTDIFAAVTVTSTFAAENFIYITTTETVTFIIIIEPQNLHN